MKKFTLFCLIMAFACWMLSGLILASIGEKGFEELSQKFISSKLITINNNSNVENLDTIEEKQLANFNEIEILAPNTDIELSTSPDAMLHLKHPAGGTVEKFVENNGKKIKFDLEKYSVDTEKFATLRLFDQDHLIHLGSRSFGVKFQIPKNIKIVRIKTNSGDVKINNITGELLKFESTSGEVKLSEANFNVLDISTISGDIKYRGASKSSQIQSISGAVKISFTELDPSALIKTTSGDVKITFDSEPDVKVDFETISGAMSLESENEKIKANEESRNGSVKKAYVLGQGKGYLKVKTVSGEFKLRSELAD